MNNGSLPPIPTETNAQRNRRLSPEARAKKEENVSNRKHRREKNIKRGRVHASIDSVSHSKEFLYNEGLNDLYPPSRLLPKNERDEEGRLVKNPGEAVETALENAHGRFVLARNRKGRIVHSVPTIPSSSKPFNEDDDLENEPVNQRAAIHERSVERNRREGILPIREQMNIAINQVQRGINTGKPPGYFRNLSAESLNRKTKMAAYYERERTPAAALMPRVSLVNPKNAANLRSHAAKMLERIKGSLGKGGTRKIKRYKHKSTRRKNVSYK